MALSHDTIRSRISEILRVGPEQVRFVQDEETGLDKAELPLHDSQFDWVLQGNGRLVRQAAMDLGIAIEVCAADPE